MNIPSLFTVLSIVVAGVSSHTLHCTFENKAYDHPKGKSIYQCNAKDNNRLWPQSDVQIDKVTGTHLKGLSNADVKGLSVANQPVIYLPAGLEQFFPQLELIDARHSSLKEIAQDDFGAFQALKFLYLANNKLERIRGDTFALNRALEIVWLDNNNIVHIDHATFSDHSALKSLRLDANNCYGRIFNADTSEDVKRVAKQIRDGHCYNEQLAADYFEIDDLLATARKQGEKIHGLKLKISQLTASLYSLVGIIITIVLIMIGLVISIVVIKCTPA